MGLMEPTLRARVRAGDPDAFGLLFDDCVQAVYNHAFRLTGDWSVAEEVVSLTFLEAWRLRAKLDPDGGSMRPWVHGICVNVARNIGRAERRHRAAMSRLVPPSAVADFADEVAGRLDDAARIAEARKAIGTLNRQEREVIELCVWSGLDYAMAAEALGIPVGTVRSRLSLARKKLERLVPRAGAVPAGAPKEPDGGRGQVEGSGPETAAALREEQPDEHPAVPRS
jgi:RNA polymerase sigma-70 factor, ECF subfamily